MVLPPSSAPSSSTSSGSVSATGVSPLIRTRARITANNTTSKSTGKNGHTSVSCSSSHCNHNHNHHHKSKRNRSSNSNDSFSWLWWLFLWTFILLGILFVWHAHRSLHRHQHQQQHGNHHQNNWKQQSSSTSQDNSNPKPMTMIGNGRGSTQFNVWSNDKINTNRLNILKEIQQEAKDSESSKRNPYDKKKKKKDKNKKKDKKTQQNTEPEKKEQEQQPPPQPQDNQNPQEEETNKLEQQETTLLHPAHIVVSCAPNAFVALQALVQSMLQNTKHAALIHIHLFLIIPQRLRGLQDWRKHVISAAGAHLHLHKINTDELAPYQNPHLIRSQQRLAADSNFVRFVIADKFAAQPRFQSISAALWMDADMIVQGDIVEWMNRAEIKPRRHALAAFPRDFTNFPFVNQTWYRDVLLPSVQEHVIGNNDDGDNSTTEATKHNIGISQNDSLTFNAGIIYLNLHLYRQQQTDQTLRHICKLNQLHQFYNSSGSQAPLLLIFAGPNRFWPLPKQDSIEYLGDTNATISQDIVQKAMFLHWNGHKKPWFNTGYHVEYWRPYAPPGFTPVIKHTK